MGALKIISELRIILMGLLKDQKGVTAIEYGLIAALIALGIIVGVTATGDWLGAVFDEIAATLQGTGVPAPPAP